MLNFFLAQSGFRRIQTFAQESRRYAIALFVIQCVGQFLSTAIQFLVFLFKLGRTVLLGRQERQGIGQVNICVLRVAAQISQHLIHKFTLTLRKRGPLGLCRNCRLRRQQ